MLVELLRAKRKSAHLDDDSEDALPGIKRTRLDDRDHVPLPPLYHHVAGAPICYLATTASTTVEDPYDWTCEVCREQVASDHPAPRQHCAAHSVDVCERCHAVRAAARQLEIEPMLDDEHEEEEEEDQESEHITDDDEQVDGAEAFLEQEAEETTDDEADDDLEDEVDETQSDDGTDDSAPSGDETSDDSTDEDGTEQDDAVRPLMQAERLAVTEVQRLLREVLDHDGEMHVPVATETLNRLQQLWSAHPRSRRVALDLCTNELHADGYGRVRIEADRDLLAMLVAHLTAAEVPTLLRAVKQLQAAGHTQLLSVLLERVCALSPESAEALGHEKWHTMPARDRRKVSEALVHALGDAAVTVEAFRTGPLLQYRQTFPALHFSVTYVQDELLHRLANCDGAAALSALEKLGHVWSAFPLSGVTLALRAIARWSSLTDAAEWNKYGEAIRRLVAQHVTAQHLDALVQTCHAALQEPIVYPLMGPLYARLTEVAPPAVAASLARMHTEAQVDAKALDDAAEEADAREMAAEPDEQPDDDDEAFVATDDEEEGHALSDVVRCFASEHIEETGDQACRVPANVIYQRFLAWFGTAYPEEKLPSQKDFGSEFQQMFPNKVRTRVVLYLGILLR